MAFSRNDWISRVRDSYLGGALGEYTKLVISRKLGIEDYWSNEVFMILDNTKKYMNPEIIKSKNNREEMLQEAMRKASNFQDQILSAKNEMMKLFPKIRKKIKLLNLDSEKVLKEMIDEFLPEYSYLLKVK
jgi:hypothetical protein